MSERSPYSRVYWTVRNDDRLTTIYPHDAHLAAWLRLLIAADMAWPAPADVPASIRKASLAALCDAGVIELQPSGLFRFHGLDTERGRRREAAQASAGRRSVSGRGPSGERSVSERHPDALLAETRREETRRDTHTARAPEDTGEVAVLAWLAAHGCHVPPNGNGLHQKIGRLVDQHGAEVVIATFEGLAPLHEARQYVLGADDQLNPIPKPDSHRVAEAEREAAREAAAARRREATQRRIAELRG